MIKKNYEHPESELLIVQFGGYLCASPGEIGTANEGYGDNPLDDLGD